jgi:inositol phosphorylceramide mannosyltransferase catalytic subunit
MKTYFRKLFAPFILNVATNKQHVRNLAFGTSIPKIIHQTFPTKDLPLELKENVEMIKRLNPEWKHVLYDDEDMSQYVLKNFPELWEIFSKLNPMYGAARADFFRYLLAYAEGGVYLDIKSGVSKPLNEIIKDDDSLILSYWTQYSPEHKLGFYRGINNPNGEIQQWHIISCSGHPILKSVINLVCDNINKYNPLIHGTGKGGVLRVTGPVAYTESTTPLIPIYPCRVELSHEVAGLVYTKFTAIDGHHKAYQKTHYSQLNTSITKQSLMVNALLPFVNHGKLILKKILK